MRKFLNKLTNKFEHLVRPLKNNQGLSLIEIIIVLTLIASISAFLLSRISGAGDKAKVKSAKVMIDSLSAKLEEYQIQCGKLPGTREEAISGSTEGCDTPPKIKEKDWKDAWDTLIEYEVVDGDYKLTSYGKDKKPGGDGFAKDITNKDEESGQ